ncbi:hypothetical protein GF325_16880 [Candidatus Bathyarchaeota archaeon]|nr:hypothetical protein [Candidatus Bathyarchaeota archaeon]
MKPILMIAFIMDFGVIGLSCNALYSMKKQNMTEFNPVNRIFSRWLFIYLIITMIRNAEYTYYISADVVGDTYFSIGVSLSTWFLLPMIIFVSELVFLLYLYEKRELFILPVIVAFFIALGLYEFPSIIPYTIFSTISFIVGLVFFLRMGWKNKEGLVFSFGLFILFDYFLGFSMYLFLGNYWGLLVGSLVGTFCLNLGTGHVFEKAFLYNQDEEKQIKNSWISRMVERDAFKGENMKQPRGPAARMIQITCPACDETIQHSLSSGFISERAGNPHALVEFSSDNLLLKPCNHDFIMYMDKECNVVATRLIKVIS